MIGLVRSAATSAVLADMVISVGAEFLAAVGNNRPPERQLVIALVGSIIEAAGCLAVVAHRRCRAAAATS